MRGDAQSLVSVIVPIYNVETYLDQCLDSISAQTYRNLEVICINDGSTDGVVLAIMQRHASVDGAFGSSTKPNGGYGQGCNRGIDEARGAWISIIEPDDWIEPHMYESMLAFADSFDVPIDHCENPLVRRVRLERSREADGSTLSPGGPVEDLEEALRHRGPSRASGVPSGDVVGHLSA